MHVIFAHYINNISRLFCVYLHTYVRLVFLSHAEKCKKESERYFKYLLTKFVISKFQRVTTLMKINTWSSLLPSLPKRQVLNVRKDQASFIQRNKFMILYLIQSVMTMLHSFPIVLHYTREILKLFILH